MAGGDWLRDLARRAETDGGRAAAHAMAQEGQTAIQTALGRKSHARGTVTPAPPGGPPARISGRLQASVIATLPRSLGGGRWEATAGSHGVVYAAIQNRGGTIHARPGGYLRFQYGGSWHTVRSVTLPARPYIKPPVEQASSRISDAGASAFFRAVHGG